MLDPTSAEISSMPVWWLYLLRRYDEAVAQAGKCLDLDPVYPTCLWLLGEAYEQKGRFTEALAAETKLQQAGAVAWAVPEIARIYALSGRRKDAQRTLDELLAPSNHDYVSKYSLAALHVALGDKNQALAELEQAYAERSFYFDFVKSDPQMDPLRAEPRFQELLRRMNFPQ